MTGYKGFWEELRRRAAESRADGTFTVRMEAAVADRLAEIGATMEAVVGAARAAFRDGDPNALANALVELDALND